MTTALTAERIAFLRLHQRNMALDEPDPMVAVTSADLLALLDATEIVVRGEDEDLARMRSRVHAATAPAMTPARAVELASGTLEGLVGHPDVRNEYFAAARALREMLATAAVSRADLDTLIELALDSPESMVGTEAQSAAHRVKAAIKADVARCRICGKPGAGYLFKSDRVCGSRECWAAIEQAEPKS